MEKSSIEPSSGFERRVFIKRAAAVGAATAWTTPVVQSVFAPAFAAGTAQGECNSCLTGGNNAGNDLTSATYNGSPVTLSFGLGQLCCTDPGNGNAEPQIEVNVHRSKNKKDDLSFHFDTLVSLTCSKSAPSPAPPPHTADCANVFTGVAIDDDGNTLNFVFEDHGEPGTNVDMAQIMITGPGVDVQSSGTLSGGNLQVHRGLGPITHDCSGC
jgi:hypothetical protein